MIPEKGKNIGDEKFFAGTHSHTVTLLLDHSSLLSPLSSREDKDLTTSEEKDIQTETFRSRMDHT